MYYINIQYYFYQGTINAPVDGPLLDDKGKKRLFHSIEAAKDFLFSIGITRHVKGQTHTSEGFYEFEHGEYDRPDYKIRKKRQVKQ